MKRSNNEKILLVDDEEGIRKVLEISLIDLGYLVSTAGSGESALTQMKRDLPQIVITDIKMPGMDGIELLRQIKVDYPEIEVIMITGHGELDLAIKSIQYGAVDFVTKPVDTNILKNSIDRSFERIHENRQISSYVRQLEKDIREKENQLKNNDRLIHLGQTISGIAHGIKNIAGGLKGGTFILEQGIIHDDKAYIVKGWEMMKGNLNKISALSLDMLSYSKIGKNHFINCDPNLPLREVFDLITPKANKEGISLLFSPGKNMLPVVLDPEEIHCAILNIAMNSIEAFSEDNVFVKKEICLSSSPTNGGGVQYKITDTADGIDKNIKHQLFSKFLTTKGKKGTGFGLMLTKKIVDQHNGEIGFVSEKGKGTSFTISIPGNIPESVCNDDFERIDLE